MTQVPNLKIRNFHFSLAALQVQVPNLKIRNFHFSLAALQVQVPSLKIRNFHFSLAALQVPECIVCLERFPGLAVRTISPDSNDSECTHCRLDKYIPKLYSSANNMDPGPLPSELYTDT